MSATDSRAYHIGIVRTIPVKAGMNSRGHSWQYGWNVDAATDDIEKRTVMAQPLNIAMVLTADGSAAVKGLEEARRGVQGVGAAAKASASGMGALAAANDQAAAASQRAAAAAIGLGAAEVQARTQSAAATGALRMQTQNLAFQFQDIGTQLASGQSPFTILAQQLPQITMHGGKLTGVMGALRQSLAGFVSPLGLLTIGFTVAAGAAIDYFSEAAAAGDAAALSLEEQNDLIGRVADRWGDAWPELKAYNDELKRRAELEEALAAKAAAVRGQYETPRGQLPDINVDQAAVINDLSLIGVDTSAIMEFQRAYQTLAGGIEESTASGREARAVQELLLSLVETTGMQALADYAAQFGELAAQLDIASAASRKLNDEEALRLSRGNIPLSPYQGGRGADPRTLVDDDYWQNRFFPEPEEAARAPRARRVGRSQAERDQDSYSRIVRQAEQAIEMEMLEAEAMAMTGEAADRLRISQELLNQARSAGLDLGPEQIAELQALGATMAEVTAETQRQADAMGLRREVITDVIGGIRQAGEDGKITLQELGDIGLRVLDRVISKIQNDLVDALTELGGAGGSGGFLSSIFGAIFGGGSNVSLPNNAPIPTARPTGPGFSAGGFTGAGHPSRVAGVVHQEEYVFSAPAVRSIGVGNLERMHRAGQSGRGFADGGYTGGIFPAGMAQRQMVDVQVSVANDGNLQAYVKKESRMQAGEVVAQAAPQIVNAASHNTMKSFARGDADDVMQGRFGTRVVPRRLG